LNQSSVNGRATVAPLAGVRPAAARYIGSARSAASRLLESARKRPSSVQAMNAACTAMNQATGRAARR
jgi:hypothetical protein